MANMHLPSHSKPESHWNRYFRAAVIVFAIAGYWLMFYSMGASTARHDERAQRYGAAYAADAVDRVEKQCVGLLGRRLAECATEIVDASRESQRSESDLGAQWEAANWVKWAGVLAAAQLFISGLGLYALLETIKQGRNALKRARKANQIARHTAKMQLRPYLYLESVDHLIVWRQQVKHFDMLNPSPKVTIPLKNFGQTPAKNIRLRVMAEVGGYWSDRPLANLGEATTIHIGDLAPQAVFTQDGYTMLTTTSQIAEIKSGVSTAFVEGQIDYTDNLGGEYYTRFQIAYSGETFARDKPSRTPHWNDAT